MPDSINGLRWATDGGLETTNYFVNDNGSIRVSGGGYALVKGHTGNVTSINGYTEYVIALLLEMGYHFLFKKNAPATESAVGTPQNAWSYYLSGHELPVVARGEREVVRADFAAYYKNGYLALPALAAAPGFGKTWAQVYPKVKGTWASREWSSALSSATTFAYGEALAYFMRQWYQLSKLGTSSGHDTISGFSLNDNRHVYTNPNAYMFVIPRDIERLEQDWGVPDVYGYRAGKQRRAVNRLSPARPTPWWDAFFNFFE